VEQSQVRRTTKNEIPLGRNNLVTLPGSLPSATGQNQRSEHLG
jgi:hypothetical protein